MFAIKEPLLMELLGMILLRHIFSGLNQMDKSVGEREI
jgi:hypothetical protein